MKRHRGQMSDSLRLGTVLTLAGGLQDAYSYNCRGQVFANAQTGNIVLLGQSLAGGMNPLANALMSFACAMQVDSFRNFRGVPCATTMCIGNMRSGTELLSRYHITRDKALLRKSLHYYYIILVFAAGAALGAVLTRQIGEKTIWIAAGLMAVGFALMFLKEETSRSPST